MFVVGKILEGEDGVEVGQRTIVILVERKWERNIFIQGKHFISSGSRDVQEDEDFVTLMDIRSVDLEKVLGVTRDEFNIKVASGVAGSIKNDL